MKITTNWLRDHLDTKLTENQIIKAKVVEILKSFVVCDARAKSEAMIPISEFKEEELSKLKAYWMTDKEPQVDWVGEFDVFDADVSACDICITNPPWYRKILHPMIEHLAEQTPTWLLFDADWMHTKQAMQYLPFCRKIVSVGRVKWFGDTSGKDNCCWYLFSKQRTNDIKFYGR